MYRLRALHISKRLVNVLHGQWFDKLTVQSKVEGDAHATNQMLTLRWNY